ncbi:MAG: hypothetical protein KF782_13590 [Labilithrix sp.]|nr:hypothetical protein [Labilithrix sp.]
MSTFDAFDVFDLVEDPRPPSATGEEAKPARGAQEQRAPRRHWWSSFEGWRRADLDAEFVLA